jgi:hypothetical protein
MKRVGLLAAALTGVALLLGGSAQASQRYAVVIGSNRGDAGETPLRFAERDALRIAQILGEHGGFHSSAVRVLTAARAAEVRQAIDQTEARIRAEGAHDALLFVFYSGHADAEALHLGGERLPLQELSRELLGSPAAARVLVLDACRSGAMTRVKGGKPGPSFEITFADELQAKGTAIVTSSAAGEDAHESDALGASFFTHYLASALLGASDDNEDGVVTLSEAFTYASARTVAATAETVAGPQHPTYRLELKGRQDLVLTRPGRADRSGAVLVFGEPGSYVVQSGRHAAVVAEVHVAPGRARRISVAAGRYRVTHRTPDRLARGEVTAAAGSQVRVAAAELAPIARETYALKGYSDAPSGLGLFAAGGVRGEVLGLGYAPRGEVGLQLDVSHLSIEGRLGYAGSWHRNPTLRVDTHELGLVGAVLGRFDAGPLDFGFGLEIALTYFHQRFEPDAEAARNALGLAFGALARVEWNLGERLFLRLDGALLGYLVQTGATQAGASHEVPITFRTGLGLGFRL